MFGIVGHAKSLGQGERVSDDEREMQRPIHDVPFGILGWFRLAVQVLFLVFSPQAFSAAFAGVRSIVASIAGGLPVDVAGFVALLIVLCLFTAVFGRFFCGWACAFGFLGDVLYYLGTSVLHLFGRKRRTMSARLEDRLRLGKYVVLVLVLVATAFGFGSFVTAVSPWTAFGHLVLLQPEHMGIVGTVVLACLIVPMLVKERAFCEFLCPLGAIFSLLPQLPSARMRRDCAVCTGCARCQRSCPVAIYPPDGDVHMGECIACERCMQVCPEHCVSCGEKCGKPAQRVIHALLLAVLLLAAVWAVGSVNLLPSPQDIFVAPG